MKVQVVDDYVEDQGWSFVGDKTNTWCKDFEYPWRVSNKKEFNHIYNNILRETYETKKYWFNKIKNYMITNYSNKKQWINSLLDIYNI